MNKQYPQTAALLLEKIPTILKEWEQRVRAEIPASRYQDKLVLLNNLAPLLQEVTEALAPTGVPLERIQGLTYSQDHGRHRAELLEYSIDEMFLEYRVLRQTILSVLNGTTMVEPEQREVITNALERAMQDAVGQFALVHEETERQRADLAAHTAAELKRLYERERRIAQVLQRPLLPEIAEDAVPGVSLATFYIPAIAEAEIGGDFLDVFSLPDGRAVFVVGDASGKGVEAAAHNMHIKDSVRIFMREQPDAPGQALARVNRVVCDTLAELSPDAMETFIVLAVLVLDPKTGEGCYVSAGAEPLLVIRTGGEAETLSHPCLPLGIEPETVYRESAVTLGIGDTAVLLTDGITEARHGGTLLGFDGMQALAQTALGVRTLQAAGEAILTGARRFAQGQLTDDACLILVRRH